MNNPSDISISLALAAVFGLLHVIFTLRVGNYRFKSRISLGDGGDPEMRNRIRAHGNFIENVPIAVLLILLNDLDGAQDNTLILMGSILLISRLTHYLTIATRRLPVILRPLSMIGTLGTILAASVMLLT
jgi:uncharacterized membrane protein YecN with MAPEG domain